MTIQDLIVALNKYPNATDSFKLGYLRGFVEVAILPLLSEKQSAVVQFELKRHIGAADSRV